MCHWHAIFNKYAILAVCVKDMTKTQVDGRRDLMCQLGDICEQEGLPVETAILYEDMDRRGWWQNAPRNDKTLDLDIEAVTPNKKMRVAAKQRISNVLAWPR